jgi:tRNA threonylcarbamoyladenosine biosynthesis protein TsaB
MTLGIETATTYLGVALVDNGAILGTLEENRPNVHDELLAPLCRALLTQCGVRPKELTGIAVSAGPGSFTGLRIGMAVAKGMALALEIPLATVPTLDTLAHAAARKMYGDKTKLLMVVLPARKNEVYAALFRIAQNTWSTHMPVAVMSATDAAAVASRTDFLAGDAAETVLTQCSGILPEVMTAISVDARQVALLGEDCISRGEAADTDSCEPLYVQEFEVKQTKNALFRQAD